MRRATMGSEDAGRRSKRPRRERETGTTKVMAPGIFQMPMIASTYTR